MMERMKEIQNLSSRIVERLRGENEALLKILLASKVVGDNESAIIKKIIGSADEKTLQALEDWVSDRKGEEIADINQRRILNSIEGTIAERREEKRGIIIEEEERERPEEKIA